MTNSAVEPLKYDSEANGILSQVPTWGSLKTKEKSKSYNPENVHHRLHQCPPTGMCKYKVCSGVFEKHDPFKFNFLSLSFITLQVNPIYFINFAKQCEEQCIPHMYLLGTYF